MQCICGCGKEVEGKRADAKYYSPACRVKALRSVTEGGISVTDMAQLGALSVTDVTDNDLSVTSDDECVTDNVTDKCRYLGANIHKDIDHHQSITYDVSEEGFKRRNKAWDSMSDRYKAEIRAGAIRRKAERIEQVAAVKARREAVKYAGVE